MEERIDPRWDFVEEFLARQRERGLLRALREAAGIDGRARIKIEGRWLLNLASNDYLGLKTDPRLREAAANAAQRWGSGSGSSRLVAGTTSLHLKFEEALARFHGSPAALTFSSGYAAGVGVIAALAGREDRVLLDRLCHASLYDGARLSGAALGRFRHNDPAHLAELLEHEAPRGGRTLVVTDTVFSMEGDRAPLGEIARACRERGALLLVDEAHAVGVLGPGGRGLAAEAGLAGEDALVLGTLGKAFGAAGAYVACSARIRDYLVNACRALIYSTAPPPSLIGSLLASLEAVREAEEAAGAPGRDGRAPARAVAGPGARHPGQLDPDRARVAGRRAKSAGVRRGPGRSGGVRPGDPPANCPGRRQPGAVLAHRGPGPGGFRGGADRDWSGLGAGAPSVTISGLRGENLHPAAMLVTPSDFATSVTRRRSKSL